MKKTLLALFAAAFLLAAGPSVVGAQAQAVRTCLSQDAGRALQQPQGPLLRLDPSLMSRVGITGTVASYQLCQENGRYIYVINEIGAGGRVNEWQIDATSGVLVAGP